MMSPTVSVVMSCYNASATLDKAIKSILDQTYDDFELVVVEDGSTDDTLERLQIEASSDTRINLIINDENLGLAASLNKGISASSGKYIARMDADDVAYKERLERQVSFLEKNKDVDILGTGIMQVDKASKEIGVALLSEEHRAITNRVFKKPLVYHPTIMVRKEVYDSVDTYNPNIRWAEDADLWYRIYDQVTFHNLQEPLLYYTVKENFGYKHAKHNLLVKVDNLKKRGLLLKYSPQLLYDVANFIRKVILR